VGASVTGEVAEFPQALVMSKNAIKTILVDFMNGPKGQSPVCRYGTSIDWRKKEGGLLYRPALVYITELRF
jgi:hypothetical protein